MQFRDSDKTTFIDEKESGPNRVQMSSEAGCLTNFLPAAGTGRSRYN